MLRYISFNKMEYTTHVMFWRNPVCWKKVKSSFLHSTEVKLYFDFPVQKKMTLWKEDEISNLSTASTHFVLLAFMSKSVSVLSFFSCGGTKIQKQLYNAVNDRIFFFFFWMKWPIASVTFSLSLSLWKSSNKAIAWSHLGQT